MLVLAGCVSESSADRGDGGTSADSPATDTQSQFAPATAAERTAQRLSRFIWDEERPDRLIVDEVEAGRGPSVVQSMVRDGRAAAGLKKVVRTWLGVDELWTKEKAAGLLPEALQRSMVDEAPALAWDVFQSPSSTLERLLTAEYTIVDRILAEHYGLTTSSEGSTQRISFGTLDRAGILGTASVLTLAADAKNPPFPTRRFAYLVRAMFCEREIVGPFVRVGGFPLDPMRGLRRQVTEFTMTNAECKTCHDFINAVSFAFLKFDTVGRLQERDAEGSIDSSGSIPAFPPPPQLAFLQHLSGTSFSGQPELLRRMANIPVVQACVARHWLAHARRKHYLDESLDTAVAQIGPDFVQSRGDLRQLVIQIGMTLLRDQ